jgi:hypothetical protein
MQQMNADDWVSFNRGRDPRNISRNAWDQVDWNGVYPVVEIDGDRVVLTGELDYADMNNDGYVLCGFDNTGSLVIGDEYACDYSIRRDATSEGGAS